MEATPSEPMNRRTVGHALRRHSFWYLLFLVTLGIVAWVKPQDLPVVAYKVMVVAMAPIGAFWVDHFLFARLGPLAPDSPELAARIQARSYVYAATVVALALAL